MKMEITHIEVNGELHEIGVTRMNEEVSARQDADTALHEEMTAEKTAREAAQNALNTALTAEIAERKAELAAAKSASAQSAQENAAALEAAGTAQTAALAAETETRTAADTALQNALNAETAEREAATQTLTQAQAELAQLLATETANRKTANTDIIDILTAETTERTAADTALEAALAAEITVRTDDAAAMQTAIEAVTQTAQTLAGTDTGKSARTIAAEELAKQLIPENAAEALDTLGEVASWIQAHPQEAAELNVLIQANKTAIEAAQTALDSETTARTDADTALQQSITDEKTARQDADTALQNALQTETAERTADTHTLTDSLAQAATAAEIAREQTEAAFTAALQTETERRTESCAENAAGIEELTTKLSELAELLGVLDGNFARYNPMPVGAVYVQLPQQNTPQELFGGTWQNISADYAGLFFRAEGGSAADFGENQTDAIGAHTHELDSRSWTYKPNAAQTTDGLNIQTGGFPAENAVTEPTGGNETRPVNTAIRIWKRTA